jgi:hypothetical protein
LYAQVLPCPHRVNWGQQKVWKPFPDTQELLDSCADRQPLPIYRNALIQEVLDEEGYKAHQLQYTDEKHKLHEEFVNDLFENFNVTNNPKRQKAFDLAWEKGHANGLEEVYNEFYDLVELIED